MQRLCSHLPRPNPYQIRNMEGRERLRTSFCQKPFKMAALAVLWRGNETSAYRFGAKGSIDNVAIEG